MAEVIEVAEFAFIGHQVSNGARRADQRINGAFGLLLGVKPQLFTAGIPPDPAF